MAYRVALTVVLPSICSALMPTALVQTSSSSLLKTDCHDAVEGDRCYHSIHWLREKGLRKNPDWYPTLQPNSTNSVIQAELHRKGKSDCPMPCGLTVEDALEPEQHVDQSTQAEQGEEDCRDAQPNTACYTAVTYGLSGGIKMHPDMYKGLKESADFKTVQEFLYLQNNRNGCERPCAEKHLAPSKFSETKHFREFREKKRMEDMSSEELSKYLDGKWDGYVPKQFKVSFGGEATSTFQKSSGRSSPGGEALPTTTPFGAEEQEDLLNNPEANAMKGAEADRYVEAATARRLLKERMRKEAAEERIRKEADRYFEEASALRVLKEKMRKEAAEATEARMRKEAATNKITGREMKRVEDMSHEELSEYLEGRGSVEPAVPALDNATEIEEKAKALEKAIETEISRQANATEIEEAANGTEEFESLPALSLDNVSTEKAIANNTADVDAEALRGPANGMEEFEASWPMAWRSSRPSGIRPTATEIEEAANGTEKVEALPVLSLDNVSTVEVSEDAGISGQPLPAFDADGSFLNHTAAESQPAASEETPEEVERRMEMEPLPYVESEEEERGLEMEQQPHVETPDEMERRLRAKLMEENERALKKSEEEMRASIKAEVMHDEMERKLRAKLMEENERALKKSKEDMRARIKAEFTHDEMERRLRAKIMEDNEKALKESEEDMRASIKAEVMRDLAKDKEE